ncbi:MAG: survival motor neuron interacting protein 1-domain-containing protein [Linnemannia gamsii]|nr:MAG: survival motor neuron interacting protein 1-domain-containing protein [Linnemannia gamsii]
MDDMLPSSGEEYLRMVKAQARKCPAVVVASGAGAQRHLAAKNTSRKYRTDWQSCLPAPEGCAPTTEWKDQFMEDFSSARASLKRYKQSQEHKAKRGGAKSNKKNAVSAPAVRMTSSQQGLESIENDEQQHIIPELNDTQPPPPLQTASPHTISIPKLHDEQKWRMLLYGPTRSPSARVHHQVASTMTAMASEASLSAPTPITTTTTTTTITPDATATTTTMAHGASTTTTTATANSVRQEGMPPSPLFLIRLDQGHLIQLLKYHLRWIAEDDLQEQEGKWLYAVFLKLDPLVESDQVAVLRNMAKKCARIRSHFNSGSGSKLATVNMVITIVARLFGQGDLE